MMVGQDGFEEDEAVERMNDTASPHSVEIHPKRTTSFAAKFQHKKSAIQYDLATRIAMERENTKYWARVLLLFPLVPFCVALTTILFGGVIINAATNDCNADLMRFMQGAVVLSYVLIWFYTYCWMGPHPIKTLRTVRVFYLIYGLLCFIWWGGYGTYQAATATSSGFESCLSLSPSLYIISQYEVAVFWILFLSAIGFFANEKIVKLRDKKLAAWRDKKQAAQQKQAQNEAEEEQRQRVLLDAQEKARQAEEAQRKKVANEQDRLYTGSEGEEDENGEGSDADAFDHHDEEQGDHNDNEEEEDVLFTSMQDGDVS